MTKVGIRCEDKPYELRTPIPPQFVKAFSEKHGFDFVVEHSDQRAYTDEEYKQVGAQISKLRGSPVKIIFGLKEIPSAEFEKDKVYLFFAHVIKGQSYNMDMLRQILKMGATLIDYERIVEVPSEKRLVFFGNWAGFAGMSETLRAFGQRLEYEGIKPNPFKLKPTYEYDGLGALEDAVRQMGNRIKEEGFAKELAPLVTGFIGYGNTSKGAQAIFDLLPHKEVEPNQLADLEPNPHLLYKVVFREEDTVRPRNPDATFELQHYYKHGKELYESQFMEYVPYITVLMNCIYWTDKYPKMITKAELSEHWEETGGKPRLKIVGDISCDIEGAIEFTLDSTKPYKPCFVYDPTKGKIKLGIEGKGVAVMAVDNLPTELPREASTSFSESLQRFVPAIVKADYTVPFNKLNLPPEVLKATIVYRGELTPEYEYLKQYLK